LENTRKLRYYKDVINPNLEDQKDLFVITSVKKKNNIAKTITNSHEIHSEIGHYTIPKTLWDEKIVNFVILIRWGMKIFSLRMPHVQHIKSQFQNIFHDINVSNLLTHQNYGGLGNILSIPF
jgi:hypothetical protein